MQPEGGGDLLRQWKGQQGATRARPAAPILGRVPAGAHAQQLGPGHGGRGTRRTAPGQGMHHAEGRRGRCRGGLGRGLRQRGAQILRHRGPVAQAQPGGNPRLRRFAEAGLEQKPLDQGQEGRLAARRVVQRQALACLDQRGMGGRDHRLAGGQRFRHRQAPAFEAGMVDREQGAASQSRGFGIRDRIEPDHALRQGRRAAQQRERRPRIEACTPRQHQRRHGIAMTAQQREPGVQDEQVVLAALDGAEEQHMRLIRPLRHARTDRTARRGGGHGIQPQHAHRPRREPREVGRRQPRDLPRRRLGGREQQVGLLEQHGEPAREAGGGLGRAVLRRSDGARVVHHGGVAQAVAEPRRAHRLMIARQPPG